MIGGAQLIHFLNSTVFIHTYHEIISEFFLNMANSQPTITHFNSNLNDLRKLQSGNHVTDHFRRI